MPRNELIAGWLASDPCLPQAVFGKRGGGLERSGRTTANGYPCEHQFSRIEETPRAEGTRKPKNALIGADRVMVQNPANPPGRRRRRDLAVRVRPRRASGRALPAGRRDRPLPVGDGRRAPAPAEPRFELAWCTGWEEKANDYLPVALGLAGPLAARRVRAGGRPADAHWKLGGIDRHVDPSRPVAWIDDAHDDGCRSWAPPAPGPTLLVTTDPAVGITEPRWTSCWPGPAASRTGLRARGDREHRREARRGREPAPAGVARAEHVARGRPEVELQRVPLAGLAERAPQHGQVGLRGGQPVAARRPRRRRRASRTRARGRRA